MCLPRDEDICFGGEEKNGYSDFGKLERVGRGTAHTRTQAFAPSALLKRTLATPSGSLSKRTTLVTEAIFSHSSRRSSLMSSMAAGSSCKRI